MAIRFSMSEDNSIISSTLSGNSSSLEKINVSTQQDQQNVKEATVSKKQRNFKCSNIRAMRLFYEMKQEFPNIPDDIVNHHVIENIDNREDCKAQLESEIDSLLVPIQSYPQQLHRVINRPSLKTKQADNESSIPSKSTEIQNTQINCSENSLKVNNCGLSFSNEGSTFSNHNKYSRTKSKNTSAQDIKDMRSGVCSIQITTYSTEQSKGQTTLEKENSTTHKVPHRPTTLNLNKNHAWQANNDQDFSNKPQISQNAYETSFPSKIPQTQMFCKSLNTVTTINTPTTYTDNGKSEILVNVTLSPSSGQSSFGGRQRYQSIINVHPELPFTRNVESATTSNHKSYTSVNLVLRQPSSSPQTPIDITVGPNLTYSSSSYHARLGYQNNYQITVSNECGVFSAFRVSPINCKLSRLNTVNKGNCDEIPNECDVNTRGVDCLQNLQNSIVRPTILNESIEAHNIIMKQHKQKERILSVLRKNKNKLSLVHREVDFAMQTVENDRESENLDKEIRKLRYDCQKMLNEIENLKKHGLVEERKIKNIKRRQAISFPKYKALSSPAPALIANSLQDQQQSLANEFDGSIQIPSIFYHDENSNFREGG